MNIFANTVDRRPVPRRTTNRRPSPPPHLNDEGEKIAFPLVTQGTECSDEHTLSASLQENRLNRRCVKVYSALPNLRMQQNR
jgi:hypothetical protein